MKLTTQEIFLTSSGGKPWGSEIPNVFKVQSNAKVKVKLSLCLTKHHAMKAYWGVEVKLHEFFDLGDRWR
jgi:hypothetical protein